MMTRRCLIAAAIVIGSIQGHSRADYDFTRIYGSAGLPFAFANGINNVGQVVGMF